MRARVRRQYFYPSRPRSYLRPRSLTPRMRSSLERICWLGIALPLSYSWMIWGFSLIICATWAWVIFFARRPCMMAFFTSPPTFLWLSSSVSFSSLPIFWALYPAPCFFTVATDMPILRACESSNGRGKVSQRDCGGKEARLCTPSAGKEKAIEGCAPRPRTWARRSCRRWASSW